MSAPNTPYDIDLSELIAGFRKTQAEMAAKSGAPAAAVEPATPGSSTDIDEMMELMDSDPNIQAASESFIGAAATLDRTAPPGSELPPDPRAPFQNRIKEILDYAEAAKRGEESNVTQHENFIAKCETLIKEIKALRDASGWTPYWVDIFEAKHVIDQARIEALHPELLANKGATEETLQQVKERINRGKPAEPKPAYDEGAAYSDRIRRIVAYADDVRKGKVPDTDTDTLALGNINDLTRALEQLERQYEAKPHSPEQVNALTAISDHIKALIGAKSDIETTRALTKPVGKPAPDLKPYRQRIQNIIDHAAAAERGDEPANRLEEFLTEIQHLDRDLNKLLSNERDQGRDTTAIISELHQLTKAQSTIERALWKAQKPESGGERTPAQTGQPDTVPPSPGLLKRISDGVSGFGELLKKLGLTSSDVAGAAVTAERAKTVADVIHRRTAEVDKLFAEKGGLLKRLGQGLKWMSEQNLEKVANYTSEKTGWAWLGTTGENETKLGKTWLGLKRFALRSANLRVLTSVSLMGAGLGAEVVLGAGNAAGAVLATTYGLGKGLSTVGMYNLTRMAGASERLVGAKEFDPATIPTLGREELIQKLASVEIMALAGNKNLNDSATHQALLTALEQKLREEGGATEESITQELEKSLATVDAKRRAFDVARGVEAVAAAAYATVVAPEIAGYIRSSAAGQWVRHKFEDWWTGTHETAPVGVRAPQPSASPDTHPSARPNATPSPAESPRPSASVSPAAVARGGSIGVQPSPESSASSSAGASTAPETHAAHGGSLRPGASSAPETPPSATPGAPAAGEHAAPSTRPGLAAGAAAATAEAPPAPVGATDMLKAIGAKLDSAGKGIVEFGKFSQPADADSALRYIALAEMKLDPRQFDAMAVAKILNVRDNLKELLAGHNIAGVQAADLHGALEKVKGGFRIVNEDALKKFVGQLKDHADHIEGNLKDGGALAWADRLPPGEVAKMRAMIEHPTSPASPAELKTYAFTEKDTSEIRMAKQNAIAHQLHEEGFDAKHVKSIYVDNQGHANFTVLDEAGYEHTVKLDDWNMDPHRVHSALEQGHIAGGADAATSEHAGAGSAEPHTQAVDDDHYDDDSATDQDAGAGARAPGTPSAGAPSIRVDSLKIPPTTAPVGAQDFLGALKDRSSADQISYLKRLVEPLREDQPRIFKMPGSTSKVALLFRSKLDHKLYISAPNLGVGKQEVTTETVKRLLNMVLTGEK